MDVLDIERSGGAIDYAPIQVKESCEDCSLNYYPCGGEKRIKELKGTILDLQSELARKKMSLTVACHRVEELEGKLKVAVGVLKPLANAENKIFKNDKNRTAANALKQIGEV